MGFFKRKKNTGRVNATDAEPVVHDDSVELEIVAVIMAAICSMRASSESRLIVKRITRVVDDSTNWSRIQFDDWENVR